MMFILSHCAKCCPTNVEHSTGEIFGTVFLVVLALFGSFRVFLDILEWFAERSIK